MKIHSKDFAENVFSKMKDFIVNVPCFFFTNVQDYRDLKRGGGLKLKKKCWKISREQK